MDENLKYISKSEVDLKKIAVDMYEGKIFSSATIPEGLELVSIFMPLIFLSEEQHKAHKDNNIWLYYEYLDRAGPISINGCPVFTSMKYLDRPDFDKMLSYLEQYHEQKSAFMSDASQV